MNRNTRISLMFLAALACLAGSVYAAEVSSKIGRMVVLGDSITCGVGASSSNNRYSTVLTALLKKDNPGIKQINMGLSGHALCQQGEEYDRSVIDAKPDLLVSQWGVNDNFWGYSKSQFAIRYDKLLGNIRKEMPELKIVLLTLVADFRSDYFYKIDNSIDDEMIGSLNIIIQELAAKHKCHVAYVHKAIDHNRALYSDIIHPNDAGARVMAEAVVSALKHKPMSPNHFSIVSDKVSQSRIMGYFVCRSDMADQAKWYQIIDITKDGMKIRTACPIFVKTSPIYKGKYKITVKDNEGQTVLTKEQNLTWDMMIYFRIPEGQINKDLTVAIEKQS